MKQANNNAVDLLLRSLARRGREDWPAGERDAFTDGRSASQVNSDHLDADELNLYAEGVLPAPARARYAEHLADCVSCRRLVVTLAQAAGTSNQFETANQQSGVRWWHGFSALLSLPVLRYAIPALVLTGVIGIGLIALREQRRTVSVARNQTGVLSDGSAPSAPLNKPAQSTSPDIGLSAESPSATLQKSAATPNANTESSALKNNPVENKSLLDEVRDTEIGAKPPAPPAPKDAEQYPQVAGAARSSQPVYAPEPPPAKGALSEVHAKSSVRKEEPLDREGQKREEDGFKLQSKDDSPTHGPARSRAPSVGGRVDTTVTTENRVSRDNDKKQVSEEVETRSVSGRRFRRQGDAWIDSAYQSSRSTTNIARGSEQFRALVADEPGLRAIVQQLGGEVIVVWKNRAYRIR